MPPTLKHKIGIMILRPGISNPVSNETSEWCGLDLIGSEMSFHGMLYPIEIMFGQAKGGDQGQTAMLLFNFIIGLC